MARVAKQWLFAILGWSLNPLLAGVSLVVAAAGMVLMFSLQQSKAAPEPGVDSGHNTQATSASASGPSEATEQGRPVTLTRMERYLGQLAAGPFKVTEAKLGEGTESATFVLKITLTGPPQEVNNAVWRMGLIDTRTALLRLDTRLDESSDAGIALVDAEVAFYDTQSEAP